MEHNRFADRSSTRKLESVLGQIDELIPTVKCTVISEELREGRVHIEAALEASNEEHDETCVL